MGDSKKKGGPDRKMLMWGLIEADTQVAGYLKKKGGSGGWKDRWCVVSRNYLIYYKPSTKEGTPKQVQFAQGFVDLTTVIFDEVKVAEDKDPLTLQVPTPGRTYLFKCKDEKTVDRWVKTVRERAREISTVNLQELGNVQESINSVQAIFARNMAFPTSLKSDNAKKWLGDVRKWRDAINKWEPYLRKASLFLEFYFANNRSYMDWFLGPEGPHEGLHKSEETIVSFMETNVDRMHKEIKDAAQTRFFREDLEEVIKLSEGAILFIDTLSEYYREFATDGGEDVKYQKLKDEILKIVESFKAYPAKDAMDYSNYKGGEITGGESKWAFTVQSAASFLKCASKEVATWFTCQGPEFISKNNELGSVLWNGRTWLWYHPDTAFTIRFDWSSRENRFRFVPTSPNDAESKGPPLPKIDFADWTLAGHSLQSVAGGGKVAPKATVWQVAGSVPVPGALLAAMVSLIQDVMQKLNLN